MTKLSRSLALCIASFSPLSAQTDEEMEATEGLRLHGLFQSNMVIQRDKPIRIWGWADPGGHVSVSFDSESATATADEGHRWQISIPAIPANATPMGMKITCGSEAVTLENVLVGDVWVIGGQSNMQHPLSNVEGGSVEIASAHFPSVRSLTVPPMIDTEVKADFPRRKKGEQPDGDWDVCQPGTVRDFSAIGYVFGRRLHMASQVPIGLIDVSRWGTTVESWTPRPILETIKEPAVEALLADWENKIAKFDPEKDLQARIKNYKRHNPDGTAPPTEPDPGPQANQNYPG